MTSQQNPQVVRVITSDEEIRLCYQRTQSINAVKKEVGVSKDRIRRVCGLEKQDADEVRARLKAARGGTRKHSLKKAWNDANPEKYRAHKSVEYALTIGKLVREPCERCGTIDGVHAHHDDYSKRLDVRWLCPAHHKQRHRELACA